MRGLAPRSVSISDFRYSGLNVFMHEEVEGRINRENVRHWLVEQIIFCDMVGQTKTKSRKVNCLIFEAAFVKQRKHRKNMNEVRRNIRQTVTGEPTIVAPNLHKSMEGQQQNTLVIRFLFFLWYSSLIFFV